MARTGTIPLTVATATVGGTLAAHTTSLLAALATGLTGVVLLVVLLGVVLPAVWSRRPTRRAAARAVLDQLLTAHCSRPRSSRRR